MRNEKTKLESEERMKPGKAPGLPYAPRDSSA